MEIVETNPKSYDKMLSKAAHREGYGYMDFREKWHECLRQEIEEWKQGSILKRWKPEHFVVVGVVALLLLRGQDRYIEEIELLQQELELVKQQMTEMSEENHALILENEELNDKVQLLSDTVIHKVQTEEEREAAEAELQIPSEFPLTGSATMEEITLSDIQAKQEAGEELTEKEPILIFTAAEGTSVVASGSGIILSVEEDETYGKCVKIDHQNGYVSIYRNAGAIKLNEGDAISRGTVIFVIGADNTKIGFQIMYEEELVNPTDVVAIMG